MIQISDLIIAHPEITSFVELEELMKDAARQGTIHLTFDLKPEYPDAPRNWQTGWKPRSCRLSAAADRTDKDMAGETKERLETLSAPYGREVRLDDVRFESGMRLLRVTIREGMRITVLDIDPATALAWARTMKDWAGSVTGPEEKA